MILMLPAAKTLDFETAPTTSRFTQPEFQQEAARLVSQLRRLDPVQLAQGMKISEKLAKQTFDRFGAWRLPFTPGNAKQALLAYAGDLYEGLEPTTLGDAELAFAQGQVRILSGLYGLLRPLDLMQPYRLEMGAGFAPKGKKNLYAFWGGKLTEAFNQLLDAERLAGREPVLLNLASEEYARAIQAKQLRGRMITPQFQEGKAGRFKVVSFFAKRARGRMARFVIQGRLAEPAAVQAFREDGYALDGAASTTEIWCFRREVS